MTETEFVLAYPEEAVKTMTMLPIGTVVDVKYSDDGRVMRYTVTHYRVRVAGDVPAICARAENDEGRCTLIVYDARNNKLYTDVTMSPATIVGKP
jgi:hypothetical protein